MSLQPDIHIKPEPCEEYSDNLSHLETGSIADYGQYAYRIFASGLEDGNALSPAPPTAMRFPSLRTEESDSLRSHSHASESTSSREDTIDPIDIIVSLKEEDGKLDWEDDAASILAAIDEGMRSTEQNLRETESLLLAARNRSLEYSEPAEETLEQDMLHTVASDQRQSSHKVQNSGYTLHQAAIERLLADAGTPLDSRRPLADPEVAQFDRKGKRPLRPSPRPRSRSPGKDQRIDINDRNQDGSRCARRSLTPWWTRSRSPTRRRQQVENNIIDLWDSFDADDAGGAHHGTQNHHTGHIAAPPIKLEPIKSEPIITKSSRSPSPDRNHLRHHHPSRSARAPYYPAPTRSFHRSRPGPYTRITPQSSALANRARKCGHCGKIKPETEFSKAQRRNKDQAKCGACVRLMDEEPIRLEQRKGGLRGAARNVGGGERMGPVVGAAGSDGSVVGRVEDGDGRDLILPAAEIEVEYGWSDDDDDEVKDELKNGVRDE